MSNWFETHDGLWDRLWKLLAQGLADPGHPARLPCLATVSADGWPEARTVVLRLADAATATVTVHTDLYSDKMRSLAATPRAALQIWDPATALQLRLQADVSVASGPATRALWDRIPDHAQQSYGVTPPPGTAIADALDYVKDPDPESFAVLICRLRDVDVVHLGQAHRRASFSRTRGWQGQWLSP